MNPNYFKKNSSCGISHLGTIGYSRSNGLQSSKNMRPSYSGDVWDRITPWDTRNEKEEKEKEQAEKDEAFNERIADIYSQETVIEGPSTTTYLVIAGFLLGAIALLSKK